MLAAARTMPLHAAVTRRAARKYTPCCRVASRRAPALRRFIRHSHGRARRQLRRIRHAFDVTDVADDAAMPAAAATLLPPMLLIRALLLMLPRY